MNSNQNLSLCIICNSEKAEEIPVTFDGDHQKCPRCGEFKITGSAIPNTSSKFSIEDRAKLSGWILEQNQSGSLPFIDSYNISKIINKPLPTVTERATRLLLEADRGLINLGGSFDINDPRFIAATYSKNLSEVLFLFDILKDQGFVGGTRLDGAKNILSGGYIKLDELKTKVNASSNGFIAMWFNDELNEIYSQGFQLAVFNAGYNPIRIDKTEHINKIDDEIVKQINSSKFIVADFTGHRGGVYFEAGYAMGKSIPVFWTCRKDNMNDLHFDIRQFNCIDWENADELASRLATRIEAVLGPGSSKSK